MYVFIFIRRIKYAHGHTDRCTHTYLNRAPQVSDFLPLSGDGPLHSEGVFVRVAPVRHQRVFHLLELLLVHKRRLLLHLHKFAWSFVCLYVCTFVCLYEYVCMYVCDCIYACINEKMYVLMCACMHICLYVCMYACRHASCTHIRVCMHV